MLKLLYFCMEPARCLAGIIKISLLHSSLSCAIILVNEVVNVNTVKVNASLYFCQNNILSK